MNEDVSTFNIQFITQADSEKYESCAFLELNDVVRKSTAASNVKIPAEINIIDLELRVLSTRCLLLDLSRPLLLDSSGNQHHLAS
jgi:hypothetical protein